MSMGLSLGGRLLEGLDRSRTLLAEIFWLGRSFASWHVMIGDVEDVMVVIFRMDVPSVLVAAIVRH
jgi:hypothetical protein